jgi:hypothetical protein
MTVTPGADAIFLRDRHQSMFEKLPESTRKSAMWTVQDIIAIWVKKAMYRKEKKSI